MFLKQTLDKITAQRAAAGQSSRRRKYGFYAIGGLMLLLVVLYFVRQFNALTQNRQLGLSPPTRQERLDTTRGKPAALTRLYEQEEKNRYQDSVSRAREEKALDYIVMDWENLYEIKKKQAKAAPQPAAQASDSLAVLLRMLGAKDSIRLASTPQKPVKKAAPKQKVKSRSASRKQEKQAAYAAARVDPFNTVRADGYGNSQFTVTPPTTTGVKSPAVVQTRTTPTSASVSGGLIPAVIHGEHKVKPGGKVVFRSLEAGWAQGTLLPRNTLITGIADFTKGRISFSSFRAKVAGQSLVLPFTCYDSDLMAGLSYADQPVTETEVRRNAVTSLTNAAGELSNAIPYGALARATSGIARGAIRGSARSRQGFIFLPDGYKVFLQPQPQQQ
ncbi:MAG: conjugative transposon protein TraM [Cytophagales bacterium]|nr:conjugative transposon protein TraM [Cytophagales bacterium]